jgi:hypothetical protein
VKSTTWQTISQKLLFLILGGWKCVSLSEGQEWLSWSQYILYMWTPWLESTSELYRPSYHRLSAKLVPTFADRGCRVVSVTDPYGRILGFLDRIPCMWESKNQNSKLKIKSEVYVSCKSVSLYVSVRFSHPVTVQVVTFCGFKGTCCLSLQTEMCVVKMWFICVVRLPKGRKWSQVWDSFSGTQEQWQKEQPL